MHRAFGNDRFWSSRGQPLTGRRTARGQLRDRFRRGVT